MGGTGFVLLMAGAAIFFAPPPPAHGQPVQPEGCCCFVEARVWTLAPVKALESALRLASGPIGGSLLNGDILPPPFNTLPAPTAPALPKLDLRAREFDRRSAIVS